jgi:hypothetical protein
MRPPFRSEAAGVRELTTPVQALDGVIQSSLSLDVDRKTGEISAKHFTLL